VQVGTEEIIIKGTPICRGIAMGKLFFINRKEFTVSETSISPSQTEHEIERYRTALSRSKQDLKRLQKQLEAESALEGILILEAQLEMLHDPLLTDQIESHIRTSCKNAEFIFQQALLKFQGQFQALNDSFFTERFKDLQDLSSRIFGYLYESGNFTIKDVSPHSIVCALELTASDAAEASSWYVGAFITETGGATSHAAIVAKAKGIPYVTNINLDYLKTHADSTIIVDGRTGKIIINPTDSTLKHYESLKKKMNGQIQDFEKAAKWPAQTFDGYNIRLSANLDTTQELDLINHLGGQGIGLFRSEYLFLPKYEAPSEDEQFQVYYHIVEKMKQQPVVIRTFDLGGDKALLNGSSLENKSVLGSKATTRHLLKEKTLLKTQLRAILRASAFGNISILFPMIATITELREAKHLIQEVAEELKMSKIPRVGCMIEVPSAALIIDHFAKECDFFSIGTNDLIHYSLAIDRNDQMLSEFYEPTDPSIIRLIKLITTEANKRKIAVSVCGEIASDPRFTPLLIGLGVQELSVAPRYLPIVKNAVRSISIVDAVQLAEKALVLKTAQEVLQLLVHEYKKNVPHDLFYNTG
jgi:phosphoenolpyruvate-protein phosphotransferase (PTS system enzyme I)